MKPSNIFKAGLFGLAVLTTGTIAGTPILAQDSEVLHIMEGTASSNVKVALNRAIVMESDVTFAELSVANPAIADIATLSDKTIYILGKAPGRTTLTLLGPNGRLITNVEVQVAPDIAEFKERLREILPEEEIEVRTANDGIVLSGRVSGARKVARALELGERYAPGRVTNLMVVGGTQQVMLKVKFAEMTRSVAKNLGASMAYNTTGNSLLNSGATGTLSSDNNIQALQGINNAVLSSSASRNGVMVFGLGGGTIGAALMIEALESKGLVRTLAEPNLIALSGKSATFLAGGEYPIPVASSSGTTIEYKKFGIQLGFTPTVVDDDLINLELNAEVSAIDPTVTVTQSGGISVNGFKNRSTNTTVEMRDGQSFAIAGLIQDDFQDAISQLPWIGDMPVLGSLFRSTNYERRQSELVIVVTAHLVTATTGEALAMPTDRVRIPTEGELFLFGRSTGKNYYEPAQSGAAGEVARQDFSSSYGYAME